MYIFYASLHEELRDYHEELKSALMVIDPGFQVEELAMWKEHFPQCQSISSQQLVQADDKIDQLVLSQSKLSFEADALALARDAAQLGSLYGAEQKTERAARLAKVLHLKQQNQIGSNLVTEFMQKRRQHVAGPHADLTTSLEKAMVNKQQSDLFIVSCRDQERYVFGHRFWFLFCESIKFVCFNTNL